MNASFQNFGVWVLLVERISVMPMTSAIFHDFAFDVEKLSNEFLTLSEVAASSVPKKLVITKSQ